MQVLPGKKTHSRSQLVFSPPLLAAVALQTSGAAVETSGQSLPISPCMKTKEPKCSLNYWSRAVPTWPDVLLSRKALSKWPRKDVTKCFFGSLDGQNGRNLRYICLPFFELTTTNKLRQSGQSKRWWKCVLAHGPSQQEPVLTRLHHLWIQPPRSKIQPPRSIMLNTPNSPWRKLWEKKTQQNFGELTDMVPHLPHLVGFH